MCTMVSGIFHAGSHLSSQWPMMSSVLLLCSADSPRLRRTLTPRPPASRVFLHTNGAFLTSASLHELCPMLRRGSGDPMPATLISQNSSQAPQQGPEAAAEACAPHFDNVSSYCQSIREKHDPGSLNFLLERVEWSNGTLTFFAGGRCKSL